MNKIATLLIFGLLAAFAVSCGNNQVAQNPKLETSPAPLSDTSNPYLDASGNAINHNWLQDSSLITTATPAGPYALYLSDLEPDPGFFISNGWGPYERDTSNGEQQAGDGKTIALNGKRYAKGLGVHSISDLQFDLTGKGCTRFQADVGIDQEIRSSLPSNNPGAAPNVIFAVTDYASGKVLTATYTGLNVSSPVVSLDVNVTGVNKLQLAMSTTKPKSARDWAWFTHADWANARVTCKQPLPIIP